MIIVFGKFIKDENDLFDIMDDWLWRDCFVFVGWFGLLFFFCVYFVLGGWFIGIIFVILWYIYGLVSFYLEGCNFLIVVVFIFVNSLVYFLLLLWGFEV